MTFMAAPCTSRNRTPIRAAAKARVRCFAHRLVHAALHLGERPGDGKRAGDVGGVQAVGLDTGIDQDQVAGGDRAVVARPVQIAGVGPRRGDRVVALAVAVFASRRWNTPSTTALAAGVGDGGGELADDVVEPVGRDLDRTAHLGDLELVLDEAQLGDEPGQRVVLFEHQLARDGLELVQVGGRDLEVGGDAGQGRAGADPELADRGIGIELGRRPGRHAHGRRA